MLNKTLKFIKEIAYYVKPSFMFRFISNSEKSEGPDSTSMDRRDGCLTKKKKKENRYIFCITEIR